MDADGWEKEREQEEAKVYQEDDLEDHKDREKKEREDHMAFKALQDIREDLESNFRNNNNRNAEV